jgi:hypothetical protein
MQHNEVDSDPLFERTISPPGWAEAPMTTTERRPSGPPPPAPGSNRPMLLAVLVLAVAVAAGLVAAITLTLNREPTPTPQAPAPQASEAPTFTPTPTPTSESTPTAEQQAVANAEAAYRRYLARVSETLAALPFGSDYGAYENAYRDVAVGVALTEAGLEAGDAAKSGQRLAGSIDPASLEVVSVGLRADGEYVPEVVLEACEDYSQVDVLDVDGQSVKEQAGATRYRNVVTVRQYPDLGGWLVAETTADGTTC